MQESKGLRSQLRPLAVSKNSQPASRESQLEEVQLEVVDISWGTFYLTASAAGLTGVSRHSQGFRLIPIEDKSELAQAKKNLKAGQQQLIEYLHGFRQTFDIPLDWKRASTPLQKQVWQALLTIPFGHVFTYSEVASIIQKPQAQRAVGTTIGHNPWGIIVPCHRVIRKDSTLGGFAWGIDFKKRLLSLEQQSQA